MEDVVIVGAGVIGCAIAFELASRHRAKVVLLERAVPGAEASSAAAGILGAQLESHDATHDALFRMMLASREAHAALDGKLRESIGLGTGYRRCGALVVTRERTKVDALVRAHAWQRALGGKVDALDGASARALEPNLADDVAGGISLPDEGQVDPPLLLRALQQACARLGVVFRSGVVVRGVRREPLGVDLGGEVVHAGAVVIAAGSWSSLVGGLPEEMRRVRPVRGQIVQVETRPPIVDRVVVGDRGYVLARPDGRTLLGSTMEEVGHVKEVTAGGVHDVLRAAIELVPAVARAPISSTWAGFRPATPDDRPLLGGTSTPGLFVATGHHRNGILLAPETARLLADLVATGRCDRDLSPFAPQ